MRPRNLRNQRKLNAGIRAHEGEETVPGGPSRGCLDISDKDNNVVLKQYLRVISSCCLVACAGGGEPSLGDEPHAARGGSDCISTRTIRDYRVLDDSNLVVTAQANNKYHVTLSRRAVGLRSSWKIGFRSTSGRVCGGFDDILVDDGFGPERIRIAAIRQLTPEEYDALMVRFGKKEPAIEQAPAKDEVESAEVEELD